MHRLLQFFFLGCLSIIFAGCVLPAYYKEASSDQPHAILQFVEAEGKINAILGGLKVTPIKINDLRPNEWTKFSLGKFLILPGNTSIFARAHVSSNVAAYGYLNFEAEAGETYTVTYSEETESIKFNATDSKGQIVANVIAEKKLIIHLPFNVPAYVPTKDMLAKLKPDLDPSTTRLEGTKKQDTTDSAAELQAAKYWLEAKPPDVESGFSKTETKTHPSHTGPAPTRDFSSPAPSTSDALMAVQLWSRAWSSKDVEGYLASYGAEFKPSSGMTRKAWEDQRRKRLTAPNLIRLTIADLQVKNNTDKTVVTFRQEYTSNLFADVSLKRLELINRDGAWRIVKETSRPIE